MGLIHVTVTLRPATGATLSGKSRPRARAYEADFLVDTGATDSMAPTSALKRIGVKPVGSTSYELADGSVQSYSFGLVQIEFMGEITAGRVVFGPDRAEPILGVTALESVGITVDPTNRRPKRLPAIPLKTLRRR